MLAAGISRQIETSLSADEDLRVIYRPSHSKSVSSVSSGHVGLPLVATTTRPLLGKDILDLNVNLVQ